MSPQTLPATTTTEGEQSSSVYVSLGGGERNQNAESAGGATAVVFQSRIYSLDAVECALASDVFLSAGFVRDG